MAFNPTHSNNLIHSINVNNTAYEIHDAHAVHTLADLADLGMDTSGVFVFKGTVATVADLPTTGNKVGYVYHVTANHSEYVWAKVDGGTTEGWEEFGEHFVVNHKHNVTVTGTNATSAVTGSATVTGGNSTSKVTGTVTVTGTNGTSSVSIPNAPKVTESAVYAKVNTGNADFVKSYPGTTSKMVTTSVVPAGAATSVVSGVTPTTGSVTGVSGSVTASKATAGDNLTLATRASSQTTVGNANVGIATTVATGVTGGSAASWAASVTDGVLSFSFTPNTLQTATTTSITPAATSTTKIYGVGGTKTVTPYTFEDVTVPKAATAASTFVTGVSADKTDVATVGTAVTVATGSLSSSGAGSSVMTSLGTATTGKALTSASLVAGTSTDGMHTGDNVTISTQTLTGTAAAQTWTQATGTINSDATAAAQTWTQNTGSISGTAAAQVWTQKSGVTGSPVSE